MALRIHILTLFPEAFDGFLSSSIVRIAQECGALAIERIDFRRYATDRHRTVDDRPFGGGPGMLLKPEPIFAAVEELEAVRGPMHRVLLTPAGRRLDQAAVERLARLPEMSVLCGRYEGVDERVRLGLSFEEVSIGDYVLSGGEVPAMVLVDSIARLLPGVLGDERSSRTDSFAVGVDGRADERVEYPQYTRPREFRGMAVPDVLVSGDHGMIESWRREQSIARTEQRDRRRRAGERTNEGA